MRPPRILWRNLHGWLFDPAAYLALGAFSFGLDGLHRCTPHMCNPNINSSWVSQLLSYCITFLPEPDKYLQLPGIHDP